MGKKRPGRPGAGLLFRTLTGCGLLFGFLGGMPLIGVSGQTTTAAPESMAWYIDPINSEGAYVLDLDPIHRGCGSWRVALGRISFLTLTSSSFITISQQLISVQSRMVVLNGRHSRGMLHAE